MKRFIVPRIAHCGSGHAKVPGMTENCLPLWGSSGRWQSVRTLFDGCPGPSQSGANSDGKGSSVRDAGG